MFSGELQLHSGYRICSLGFPIHVLPYGSLVPGFVPSSRLCFQTTNNFGNKPFGLLSTPYFNNHQWRQCLVLDLPALTSADLPPEMEEEGVAEGEVPVKRIRVKLRSHFVAFVEEATRSVIEAARRTNARISGPVFMPRKKHAYCLPKSPHAHKDAMRHYVVHIYTRLVDIHDPCAETLDALMELELPPAVKVQVQL